MGIPGLKAVPRGYLSRPGYSREDYRAGQADARRDVQQGRLIVEIYGLLPPWFLDHAGVLHDRYRVKYRIVGGCVVDPKIEGHSAGYNNISEAEIDRRFGKDALLRSERDAQQTYYKEHPSAPRNPL